MATPRINHNSVLTDVHRSLAIHNANTGRQITQLSSGLRINRYSDDPASLALADGISSEVRAIAEGTRNIQQTFSLLQVADGSLNEIGDMVNRMRALAMQGASATLNDSNQGLYEPIHGSAPDIAGQGKANPLATVLSAGMMLRYSLHLPEQADRIAAAVAKALADGARSFDLGGTMSTVEMGDAVLAALI